MKNSLIGKECNLRLLACRQLLTVGMVCSLSLVTGEVAEATTFKGDVVSDAFDPDHGLIKIIGESEPIDHGLFSGETTTLAEGGYSINSTQDGGLFSQIITIESPDSPDSYLFTFELPDEVYLEDDSDGGAYFRSVDGEAIGRVRPPWAIDAQGTKVNTHFQIRGNEIVQQVDLSPGLQYPVIADPEGAWGWTKCVAAVTAVIAVPAGAAVKLARFVRNIGNVKEAMQLLTGATTNAERLEAGLAAAGATAGELLGIAAVQENC